MCGEARSLVEKVASAKAIETSAGEGEAGSELAAEVTGEENKSQDFNEQ